MRWWIKAAVQLRRRATLVRPAVGLGLVADDGRAIAFDAEAQVDPAAAGIAPARQERVQLAPRPSSGQGRRIARERKGLVGDDRGLGSQDEMNPATAAISTHSVASSSAVLVGDPVVASPGGSGSFPRGSRAASRGRCRDSGSGDRRSRCRHWSARGPSSATTPPGSRSGRRRSRLRRRRHRGGAGCRPEARRPGRRPSRCDRSTTAGWAGRGDRACPRAVAVCVWLPSGTGGRAAGRSRSGPNSTVGLGEPRCRAHDSAAERHNQFRA